MPRKMMQGGHFRQMYVWCTIKREGENGFRRSDTEGGTMYAT